MTMPFDTTKPNMARMYDYWLGGKDKVEAGRKAAEAVRALRPNVAQQAFDNKKFQTRAVTYVAGQGVRQFVDIGSGLSTSPGVRPAGHPRRRRDPQVRTRPERPGVRHPGLHPALVGAETARGIVTEDPAPGR